MLVQKYKDMLSAKSVIRQLSEFATARGQEIGYENVFDYSLGNPSVPVPREFTDTSGIHGPDDSHAGDQESHGASRLQPQSWHHLRERKNCGIFGEAF